MASDADGPGVVRYGVPYDVGCALPSIGVRFARPLILKGGDADEGVGDRPSGVAFSK